VITAGAAAKVVQSPDSTTSTCPVSFDRLRLVWRISLCLLILQLIGMLAFSTIQYERFNLTTDFAFYSQAWAAIANGHLSPFSSLLGVPFWRNDFELLMWPLAVFYWVNPHGVTLLWLQDMAIFGGELVVLVWARDIIRARKTQQPTDATLLALVAALLLLSPWSWFTIGFDFHFEAFTVLFALLAARAIWAARYRHLIVWVPLTLASSAASGGLLVVGVGLAALMSGGKARQVGLAVTAAGIVWLALAAGLGAMRFNDVGQGLDLSSMYGYLSAKGSHSFGYLNLVQGLLTNPLRAFNMFESHLGYVLVYLASSGVIGLWSRWGALISAIVLLPSALNANTDIIHFAQAFQSWPAMLFLVIGYALVLRRLSGGSRGPGWVVYALGSCSLVLAGIVTGFFLGDIPGYIERVSPGAAGELAAVQGSIPSDAEVIASQGLIGRFGAGRTAFSYWAYGSRETYAITGSPVIFVLAPIQGTAEGIPAETRRAIGYVRADLDATVLVRGSGIWAYSWTPKPETKSVVLP
jgi:Predicted membrane protein (DUF2079)